MKAAFLDIVDRTVAELSKASFCILTVSPVLYSSTECAAFRIQGVQEDNFVVRFDKRGGVFALTSVKYWVGWKDNLGIPRVDDPAELSSVSVDVPQLDLVELALDTLSEYASYGPGGTQDLSFVSYYPSGSSSARYVYEKGSRQLVLKWLSKESFNIKLLSRSKVRDASAAWKSTPAVNSLRVEGSLRHLDGVKRAVLRATAAVLQAFVLRVRSRLTIARD